MNLDLTTVLNTVLRIFRYGPEPRPWRDWFVILGVAIALLAASAALNALMFLRVEQGGTLSETNAAAAPADSGGIKDLDAANAVFAARADAAATYESDPHLADPSR
jgi:hypothetical protein